MIRFNRNGMFVHIYVCSAYCFKDLQKMHVCPDKLFTYLLYYISWSFDMSVLGSAMIIHAQTWILYNMIYLEYYILLYLHFYIFVLVFIKTPPAPPPPKKSLILNLEFE